MSATTPLAALPEVTVPLGALVPPRCRHYFTGRTDRAHYRTRRYDFIGSPPPPRTRRYDFIGSPRHLPLVRAFLDTCAAERDADYRYLFTLLGSELAANALTHSRSGERLGTYTLSCTRSRDGLHLTCRDQGDKHHRSLSLGRRSYLAPDPGGLDPHAESGRGLALLDALASAWGDNGQSDYRQVWFFLAYDLTDNPWNTAA